jgi:hypothetical protein
MPSFARDAVIGVGTIVYDDHANEQVILINYPNY